MQSAFRAIVSGRVRMVRYRSFVYNHARDLGLVGEVENLPDNTVRVVAEGEKESLDELIAALKQGPILARVDNVVVEWLAPAHMFKKFIIRNPWTV